MHDPKFASNKRVWARRASTATAVLLTAATIAACRPPHAGPQVAGWSLIEPTERHPILVSKRPVTMTVPVRRGSYGLTNAARSRVARFLQKFRATDTGNSRLVIAAPSGNATDVAGMQMVAEIREMIADAGFPPSSIHVKPNPGSRKVGLSYLRVVAEAPECGLWPTNLGREPGNLTYPNFGCSSQRNLAAMVANPADLIGPRTQTPRLGDRRHTHYEQYVKGESTGAKKSADEKINTEE